MEKIAREEEKKALNDFQVLFQIFSISFWISPILKFLILFKFLILCSFQTALAERTVKIDESSLKKPQIVCILIACFPPYKKYSCKEQNVPHFENRE